jgi:hypothetical protein
MPWLIGLLKFLILLVELAIIGGLVFLALDSFKQVDETFKKLAKYAVGGALVLLFLFAVLGVLTGSGVALVNPINLLFFAIAVIVCLVIWYLILLALDWLPKVFPPIERFKVALTYVLSACILIMIMLAAADLVFGAGILFPSTTSSGQQHVLPSYKE